MLIKHFLEKPVLAISLCLLILLAGAMSFKELPVRHYPLLPTSEVTITTVYPGASPTVMEEFVTVPMQRALSGLSGPGGTTVPARSPAQSESGTFQVGSTALFWMW